MNIIEAVREHFVGLANSCDFLAGVHSPEKWDACPVDSESSLRMFWYHHDSAAYYLQSVSADVVGNLSLACGKPWMLLCRRALYAVAESVVLARPFDDGLDWSQTGTTEASVLRKNFLASDLSMWEQFVPEIKQIASNIAAATRSAPPSPGRTA